MGLSYHMEPHAHRSYFVSRNGSNGYLCQSSNMPNRYSMADRIRAVRIRALYQKAIAAMRNTGLMFLPMDALIAASTTTSYLMGLKSYFLGKDVHYATTAATFIFVISLGRYVEEMFRTSSAPTIAAFSNIVPFEARLLHSPTPVTSHTLKSGDFVIIDVTHRFPCDGRLVAYPNQSQTLDLNIDESIHTGELRLVKKVWGDICLAGTIDSHSQEIFIEVIEGGRNRLDQILDAVLEAQLQNSDIQPWLDRVSKYMVSCVMICTFIAFLVWLPDGFDTAATFFSTTLIVACPCAFGLSVPAMKMVAFCKYNLHWHFLMLSVFS
jgi:cation transport ATPase